MVDSKQGLDTTNSIFMGGMERDMQVLALLETWRYEKL